MTGLSLLFAASLLTIDGGAALRHARSLAALGPHAFGSPRAQAAASYVAASLREAGLTEVRLQEFESDGRKGQNVIGVLRAAGPEFVLVGAHHDSAPDAPGAYDDGGGVGVLIELARVLARAGERPRTLVFVSFDGGELQSRTGAQAVGSRAYVKSLGGGARDLVAALAIEVSGQPDGAPTLHPIAYADPLRPGGSVIAPAWLVRAALFGSRAAGAPFAVGDPLLGLVSQPAVRMFRVGLYGDDLSFAQAGLPALLVSDSSFTRFYPHYHLASDTADRLDVAALERMGRALLGAVAALVGAPLTREPEPSWYAAFGRVFSGYALGAAAFVSLAPGLLRARSARGPRLLATLAHAAVFGVLMWWQPVPALFCLAAPNLVAPLVRSRLWLLSFLPALGVVLLGAAGWLRQASPAGPMVTGLWLTPWELLLFALAALLLGLARLAAPAPARKKAAGAKRKRR